jgi:hypothetical protein
LTGTDQARAWLRDAVLVAGRDDAELWTRNVGERARVASIFHALRQVPDIADQGWIVDCEYNRSETAPKPAPQLDRVTRHWTIKRGTPDVVIHRRGAAGAANNLLVVEFKCTYSNLQDESHDIRKIEYWATTFGYRVGAVVGLGPRGMVFAPQVRWFVEGRWTAPRDLT